jgi:hypothetical protein
MEPARLLEVWERGYGASPARRGLALLQAALPGHPWARLAALSVGQRDLCLLALREATFGRSLNAFARCPHCGAALEVALETRALRLAEVEEDPQPPAPIAWSDGPLEVLFRLPSSDDLLALEQAPRPEHDPGAPELFLLERCLLAASVDGAPSTASELPPSTRERLAQQMEAHDPQANIEMLLACAQCGHRWTVLFDIVAWLWQEVESEARRTVREVHALAAAYGWHERDVLALSPWRRQLYLGLVGAA